MTEPEKIELFKSYMDDEVSDTVAAAYLKQAESKILNRLYPFTVPDEAVVPSRHEMLQIEVAVYMWAKRGADGEVTHSENGISRTWAAADVPDSMLSEITPQVGVFGS